MGLDRQAPVSSLGEDGVVELLRGRFVTRGGTVGVGDDAAVVASPGERLILTTDTLVEGPDFSLDYFSGFDLGWKALAVNVSDVAAMGGEPSYALATLCLRPSTEIGFVVDVIDGMADAANTWSLELVGGDLSGAQQISVGISLLGYADDPLLRSGAKPGDAVLVSGELGGSAGGLHLLQRDPTASGPLVDRHRRPRPRIELSRLLGEQPVTSMIDVSDGLILDLGRLMAASGTGCRIQSDLVPVDRGLGAIEVIDPLRAALFGGEDFELLFTLPSEAVSQAYSAGERIGLTVTHIGTVTGDGCFLDATAFDALEGERWDHLQSR